MKRIKVHIEGETPARKAGLVIAQAERDGFKCTGCQAHQTFGRYVMAHWGEMLVHTCQACGTVHKMKSGKITQVSGPTKAIKRVRIPEPMTDPRKAFWRCYRVLNNLGRPTTFRAITGYHDTLDAANGEAWDYVNNAEPHHKGKREDLYAALLRREEYPMMSQVEHNGMLVGFGEIAAHGNRLLGKESVHFFVLRDPRGNETTVLLRTDDAAELVKGLELKPIKK
jgi:hypothetical protein